MALAPNRHQMGALDAERALVTITRTYVKGIH